MNNITVRDVFNFLNDTAPFDTAEEWDNCGLCVGTLETECKKIYISLDVTTAAIKDAAAWSADLVLTHHPLIFDPVYKVEKGTVLYDAVKSGMTFISSHTCLDKAEGGVNDCLARTIGLKNIYLSPFDPFLKVGQVSACTANEFAAKIKNVLGGAVAYTDCTRKIEKVAVCSGSGGDLITAAYKEGADALLTGEAKHHEFLLSRELGVSLFVAGHYETENIVCRRLAELISEKFGENIEIKVSELDNPVKYI